MKVIPIIALNNFLSRLSSISYRRHLFTYAFQNDLFSALFTQKSNNKLFFYTMLSAHINCYTLCSLGCDFKFPSQSCILPKKCLNIYHYFFFCIFLHYMSTFWWINDMVWRMNDTTCWGIQYIMAQPPKRPSPCSSKKNNTKYMSFRMDQIIAFFCKVILYE